MQVYIKVIVLAAWLILLPTIALAQPIGASIAGTVRDTSGAVLPGVTVEASSPALIERVRSATTDGTGQFRIVDLRPGTYTLTFTLPGFNTVRREGVELAGTFVATINAEMRVGAIEETVTVTGESPIVDVQSARRQQVVDRDALTAIPSSRTFHNIAALVPGITTSGSQDVGGIVGPSVVTFSAYGGRGGEGRLQVDGVGVGGNTAGSSYYVADITNAQEISITTSGGMGEAEVGGPVMNVVPRTGGNTLRGSLFANYANGDMQGDNFTQELRDAGLTNPASLIKMWDVNGALGGPIRRDRLWYFFTTRYSGNRKNIENMYYNVNAGNPNAWTWVPDLNRPALNDSTWKSTTLRLTWQVNSINKVNVFWDEQRTCIACIGGGSSTVSPEAADGTTHMDYVRAPSITWTAPVTNQLLLEAGWGFGGYLYGREREGNNRDLARVTEQAGTIPGLTYRSMIWQRNQSYTPRYRASMSYVTGKHNFKTGVDGLNFDQMRTYLGNNQSLNYRLNNGVPNQLTMFVNDFKFLNRTSSFAAYAQHQATLGRLTLQGGIRFDHASSYAPEQSVGPDRFIPEQITFPRTVMVEGYNDISPRAGMALDVFGTGRTSLRVNFGRYVEAPQSGGRYTASNPLFTSIGGGTPPQTNRAWTDANRNFVPDCNLLNPAQQDLRPVGGDLCGPLANQSFGQVTNPTQVYDPELLRGWSVRADDWQFGASVQQEVLPRMSVEVGYIRRSFSNFDATDNLLVGPSDYDPYSVTAPLDPQLPGGGGYVISDLWDISPEKFGQTQNFVTQASNFGKRTEYWHGVDVNVRVRLQSLTLQGGTSTGRTVSDECDLVIDNPSRRNCRVTLPFQTQIKGLASYIIPKIDVQVSGTVQSQPGSEIAANWNVPSAVVAQTLGRPLAGGVANVTINLLNPGEMYRDRLTEVDFRVGKILRFGRVRADVGLDVYNLFNSSVVQNSITTYGPTWLRPTLVMPARFAKAGVQLDF
jgi:hypothetical protein